ncbi:MAG TPA: hypothetical protein VM580_25665 [Labilithrix sp.]|jgi:hypothetical protein|nr:hypothetical protein [Labilithrix sp.]
MCLICIEFDKQRMTVREARRALGEMRVKLAPAHIEAIEAKLAEAESAPPAVEPTAAPSTPHP